MAEENEETLSGSKNEEEMEIEVRSSEEPDQVTEKDDKTPPHRKNKRIQRKVGSGNGSKSNWGKFMQVYNNNYLNTSLKSLGREEFIYL